MANRRFEMYQYRQILSRIRSGDSDRDLSRAGLIGRKKAATFRQLAKEHGWLEVGVPLPDEEEIAARLGPAREKAAIPSLVEPHREQVEKWVAEGIDGTTIHRALVRLHSFPGSYSAIRRFIQALPEHLPKATVALDFAAGSAAQVDFGAGPKFVDPLTGEVVSSWFFVMTLCFSRHQYAEVVYNQRVDTWLACHRRAFEWFGGVPEKLIIDNAKCAITRACAKDPEVQRAYGDLALGYGFRIDPCPPRDPQKKGRVESGVKYIKRAFLPIREFRDLDDANRQLHEWLMGEAGNRCHGSTRRRPLELFAETEQPLLQPLPDMPVQLATWVKVKVHGNGHVAFEKNLYSVSFRLIRQTLWLKATDTTVQLFRDHELVAVHCRLQGCGGRATVDEHLPPDALAYKLRDPQWCLKKAEGIGPACLGLIQRLFANRVLDNLRGAQGVIRLGERYGKARLDAACARALLFDTPRYRAVKTILERGQDQLPGDKIEATLPTVYAGKSRFQREIATLFN